MGKNKKIINDDLKARAKAINWKKVIVGLLAIVYLVLSIILMLSKCTVGASSVGNSNAQYEPILPFKSVQYIAHKNQSNRVFNVDMPQLASDKNSINTFYNTFVDATTALTTEYTYQFIDTMPEIYNGIVDESDGSKWIQFTISNIETSAVADDDHTISQPPYINYYRIQIIPRVYFNNSVLGAEYRIFGGYNGSEYENSSTIVYRQYYAQNQAGSWELVKTWFYDPYTLTNFSTIIDFYNDNNLLLEQTVSLDYGTTLAEVKSAMDIITTRTAKIQDDSVELQTSGLEFISLGTGLIDGGTSYKTTYKIPLPADVYTWVNVDTLKYQLKMSANNFILDYEQYSKGGIGWDNQYSLRVNINSNGRPVENVKLTWNVTQVFQSSSIVDNSKTLTSLTREIVLEESYKGSGDVYNIRFPLEELTEEYRRAGYTIGENTERGIPRYWIVNKLTIDVYTASLGTFDNDNYIELIMPYSNVTQSGNNIWKWYNENIGSGYKGGTQGTLTAPDDFMEWIVIAVDGFFSAPIIGFISIGEILWFCIGVGMLFAVLKYFAGG